ncbi:cellulose biosynthesis protein BcsD [Pseudomonas saudiphocaensis]|uniref:cellulose biosynthesis protein BcsD n=1 Tax=Pseudomonas saudiphocaensis TaxID=1499686 RepID=UPI000F799B98|nr:cellulose biosynthesis protein BcsD [Pseudomonas saudiphocaensis]RRV17405.1 hypothetical protein EGJ00_03505 [Pseudomonas saudiphocaensis]
MTPANPIETRSLSYLARLRGSTQSLPLLQALVGEMFDSAGEHDGCLFMRHVGRRMAKELGVPAATSLEELERVINQRWAEMDWGWVELSSDGRSLTLVHGAFPGAGSGSDQWRSAMSALLEGLYEAWLVTLGEGAALKVSRTELLDMALAFRCHGA